MPRERATKMHKEAQQPQDLLFSAGTKESLMLRGPLPLAEIKIVEETWR